MVGISVARKLPEEQIDDEHHEHEGFDQRLLHLVDRRGDEFGRIVGHLPGEIGREVLLCVAHRLLDGVERDERVRAGRLIDRDQRRCRAVEARVAIEVRGAEFDPRDILQPQQRAVAVGADHDVLEFLDRRETALGLDVELDLLIVVDGPRADAADRRLRVLRLDRGDDVGDREPEAGQAVGLQPDAHRVVLRPEQLRIADAGRRANRIDEIDRRVIADEQRVVGLLRRIEADDTEQGGGLLLHRHALRAHLGRQFRQRDLHAVIDVDGVDVGIGAEFER